MLKVKGSVLQSVFSYFEQNETEELEKILEETKPSMNKYLESPVIPLQWYPVEFLKELHFACEEFFDENIHKELGRHSAQESFGKLYNSSLTSADLDYILEEMLTIWRMYYSKGNLDLAEKGDNHLRIELREFDIDLDFLVDRVLGYMEKTLEMSDLEVEKSCREYIESEGYNFYIEWE